MNDFLHFINIFFNFFVENAQVLRIGKTSKMVFTVKFTVGKSDFHINQYVQRK